MSKFRFRSTPIARGAGLSGFALRFLRQPNGSGVAGLVMSYSRPSGFTHGKMKRSRFFMIFCTLSAGMLKAGYEIVSGGCGLGWSTCASSGGNVMSVLLLKASSRHCASRSNASGGANSLAWMPPVSRTGVLVPDPSYSRTHLMSTASAALLFGSVINSTLFPYPAASVNKAVSISAGSAGFVGGAGGGTSGLVVGRSGCARACLLGHPAHLGQPGLGVEQHVYVGAPVPRRADRLIRRVGGCRPDPAAYLGEPSAHLQAVDAAKFAQQLRRGRDANDIHRTLPLQRVISMIFRPRPRAVNT